MNPVFSEEMQLGANPSGPQTIQFKVWAPHVAKVEVVMGDGALPNDLFRLQKDQNGYHTGTLRGRGAGTLYRYRLEGKIERPDPASRLQPQGVHGPSCVVDPSAFSWTDSSWKGLRYEDLIFYEIHVGTFTSEGTFEAAIEKIPYLHQLGVTCVEVMPVAQFPGKRNWGYDGVNLFAVQNSYGGPEGFKKFVDACHHQGLAVCLDVVYNHLGPEGNYLRDFGPYFTTKYHTPWGEAINYDDAYSDKVREFIIHNALYWVREYHVDALRLDAIHAICDFGAYHLLEEIQDRVQEEAKRLGRLVHVIGESDLNDPRIIQPKKKGGYDLSGQWSDDFHHAVHAYLTQETHSYYQDFGRLQDLALAIQKGFVYEGQYSSFRKRCHGRAFKNLSPLKLVVCTQNHDQIGNRALGERLSVLTSFENQKIMAVLLLLAPNTPFIFMGQEYGETSPFQYFVDHQDHNLLQAVREGRKNEFSFSNFKTMPDPGSEKTFQNCKLNWEFLKKSLHRELFELYQDLIKIRKHYFSEAEAVSEVIWDEQAQWLSWAYKHLSIAVSFADHEQTLELLSASQKNKVILQTDKNSRQIPSKGKITLSPHSAVVLGA